MKILTPSTTCRQRQDGSAVIIMLILIVMVLGFIMANTSVLSALHNDVKRIERRQIRRINPAPQPASTNAPSAQALK